MTNKLNSTVSVGVDIGGSHVTCQLFDLEQKLLLRGTQVRYPVDCHSPADEILDTWAMAIRKTVSKAPQKTLKGIGFAMPGPFDYKQGVAWFKNVDKFENLYGTDVGNEIRKRLQLGESFPIRFQNDAACFAIGESYQEKAARHSRLLAITLGTGFGTTFTDHHQPVAGKHGVPDDGFLYHIPFKGSIADEYFSTRWFINEYLFLTGKQVSGVKEIADNVEKDPASSQVFNTFGTNLGTFLSPWLKQFKAGCLVIGGNISIAFPLFKTQLLEVFQQEGVQSEVLLSQLQEDAALWGSAGLVI